MKVSLLLLLLAHATVHFLGAARGLGLWNGHGMTTAIPPPMGWLWAATGVLFWFFAFSWYRRASTATWVSGAAAIALSQSLVGSAFADAKWGSVGNMLAFLVLVYSVASTGPWSLRERYEEALQQLQATARRSLSDPLASPPDLIAKYLHVSGASRVLGARSFTAALQGRIRSGPKGAWMPFEAVQTNFIEPPARLFFMRARMAGLPVDVLHLFVDGRATMDVRLLSLFPLIHEEGPDLTRAETVTLFNDLCLLAPFGLLSHRVAWEEGGGDAHHLLGRYTLDENTVSARLTFDDEGRVVDFESDDRLVRRRSGSLLRQGWSTPVGHYRAFGELNLMGSGKALWHPPEGSFPYIELELTAHQVDVAVRAPVDDKEPQQDPTRLGISAQSRKVPF